MTSAISSHGTLLKQGDGASPEVFTTIAEIPQFDAPSLDKRMREATTHDSSGWMEQIPVLKLLSDFTITIQWIPGDSTHSGLVTAWSNDTLDNYQVVAPDAGSTTLQFAAYVKTFQPTGLNAEGEKLTASVTFSPSGSASPVWA